MNTVRLIFKLVLLFSCYYSLVNSSNNGGLLKSIFDIPMNIISIPTNFINTAANVLNGKPSQPQLESKIETRQQKYKMDEEFEGGAKTKTHWRYSRAPRTCALSVTTKSEKVLHSGMLNALGNKIQIDEFVNVNDWLIRVPCVSRRLKYTLVIYSKGYLVKLVSNIPGDNLFRGIRGDNIGFISAGIQPDILRRRITTPEVFHIEILEQIFEKDFKNLGYNRFNFNGSMNEWSNFLTGVIGKTSVVVLPRNGNDTNKDIGTEFGFAFDGYAKELETYKPNNQGARYPPKPSTVNEEIGFLD